MENLSKQNNRDSFRKTMLIQEKIFKRQVHELHRLYTVQKSLMTEINHQNFNSYSDGNQRAVRNEKTGTSNSDTSIGPNRYLQEIRFQNGNYGMQYSDEESDDLDLTLSIGVKKSVEKRERENLNCTESKRTGTGTAWLYQTLS